MGIVVGLREAQIQTRGDAPTPHPGCVNRRQTLRMKMNRATYRSYRFPPEVISHSVWLYYRFSLSLRDVEELPREALDGAVPADLYRASPRPFPKVLEPITYPGHFDVYFGPIWLGRFVEPKGLIFDSRGRGKRRTGGTSKGRRTVTQVS